MTPTIQELHRRARNWGDRTAPLIQSSSRSAAFDTGELARSIQARTLRPNRFGDIDAGFSLVRHGVFIEKGAGRGYGGRKKGNGKMGTGKRPKRPFFNPIIKREILKLEKSVGDVYILDIRRAIIR